MTEAGLDRPSTPALIGDAIKQTMALFSAEVSLVRLELTEKLVSALTAVVAIVVAAVLVIVALIFILQGVVELLARLLAWPTFAASFAVGGVVLLIAFVAVIVAVRNLSVAHLKPSRTMREVKNTSELAKGVMS